MSKLITSWKREENTIKRNSGAEHAILKAGDWMQTIETALHFYEFIEIFMIFYKCL